MATEDTCTKTCAKLFYEDHMLLSPKDVGLWDLIKLLFSKNLGSRKFIDCPVGTTEQSFSLRFLIFISVVAQKFLRLIYKPLGLVGSAIEFMPNFMHTNGGFFKLLLNIVTGKMELPNKESPEYLPSIELLDIRRDLDNRIKHDDPRYTSALAIMAAKSAYENEAYIKETVEKHWKMEFLGIFDCWNDYEEDYTTQGFMWSGKKGDFELIGVSF
ncbi:triacylglycerol lipase OBL1-like [Bidens hawaiensis]|uniref:triacylglycerol lipase OBL1-like n=1 Tax=Bidens hawaiensis TaxID=980011 RepID=UPI00404A014B